MPVVVGEKHEYSMHYLYYYAYILTRPCTEKIKYYGVLVTFILIMHTRKGRAEIRRWKRARFRAIRAIVTARKSGLGDHVQNTIDFITKDNHNYIDRSPCAAPTCTCMIHVGILLFGSILVVLHARWGALFDSHDEKSDRAIGSKNVTAMHQLFFLRALPPSKARTRQLSRTAAQKCLQIKKVHARTPSTRGRTGELFLSWVSRTLRLISATAWASTVAPAHFS